MRWKSDQNNNIVRSAFFHDGLLVQLLYYGPRCILPFTLVTHPKLAFIKTFV